MDLRNLLLTLAAALAFSQTGNTVPGLRGETLDGKKIVLAEAGAGKTTLLVLGFSKKAGDVTRPWRDHFTADFGAGPHTAYFAVAFLEDAPSLLRGMIKSGMRSGMPPAQQSHLIVVTSDEAVWKRFVHMADDKLPSVLLLDNKGQVRWAWNGEFDPVHYAALKETTASLLKP